MNSYGAKPTLKDLEINEFNLPVIVINTFS